MRTRRATQLALVTALGACAHGPAGDAVAPPAAPSAQPSAAEANIDAAIAVLHGPAAAGVARTPAATDASNRATNPALERAWSTLKAQPALAVPRVRRELEALWASGRRDDFFSIEAAGVLWEMAGVEAAPIVARALDGVEPGVRYPVFFATLASAAVTRDERVLPILWHALGTDDKTGTTYFPAHYLTVGWPTSLDFTVAAFGPALCEKLPLTSAPPGDARVARSVLYVATALACPGALPIFRRWVQTAEGDVRTRAITAVGHVGAPADRGGLLALTRNADAATRRLGVLALTEHGDPASNPTLRKLLADADPEVRLAAITGVFHLIDVASARALLARQRDPRTPPEEVVRIELFTKQLARETEEDVAELQAGTQTAWQVAIAKYWKQRTALFTLRPDERRCSHDELAAALAGWERQERLPATEADDTSWIDKRQILAAATPADLPKLVSVRARILHRQSDEALEEVKIIDRIVRVLRRRAAGAAKPYE